MKSEAQEQQCLSGDLGHPWVISRSVVNSRVVSCLHDLFSIIMPWGLCNCFTSASVCNKGCACLRRQSDPAMSGRSGLQEDSSHPQWQELSIWRTTVALFWQLQCRGLCTLPGGSAVPSLTTPLSCRGPVIPGWEVHRCFLQPLASKEYFSLLCYSTQFFTPLTNSPQRWAELTAKSQLAH